MADHPATLDRSAFELAVADDFDGAELDRAIWFPHYLPQWSSRAASAARYEVGGGRLRLRIDHDQQPWCPEWNGHLRVSSLQTGVFAGAFGSAVGQHRFDPRLAVREEQPVLRLLTPLYGLVEIAFAALADPTAMVALWMIGFEDEPARSGEICVAEIFGRDVTPERARIGMGVRAFADPSLSDDFDQIEVAFDARAIHAYAVDWRPDSVRFYVDERLVRIVPQAPAYPMQLMLSLYEFADGPEPPSPPDRYPKAATVDWVRYWQPR